MKIPGSFLLLLAAGAAAIAGAGTYLLLSGGQGTGAAEAGSADIRIISKGEAVNLRDHLAPGKYTLFDYYADWCPPCRELSPRLEDLARHRKDLAIRKIDIVDWSHPVADQQGVHDLPYLRLYGPDGGLIREGDATFSDLERLFGFDPASPRP